MPEFRYNLRDGELCTLESLKSPEPNYGSFSRTYPALFNFLDEETAQYARYVQCSATGGLVSTQPSWQQGYPCDPGVACPWISKRSDDIVLEVRWTVLFVMAHIWTDLELES